MATTTIESSEISLLRSSPEKSPKMQQPLQHRPGRRPSDGEDTLIQVSLHQKKPSIGQYQTTCISKHYALNDQILTAFETHYQQGLYKVAFYLGLKFVETALLETPKHGYFYADKFAHSRKQSAQDALRVTLQLQEIVTMDADSLANEYPKVERLQYLATEQCERLGTYEAKRVQVEKEIQRMNRKSSAAKNGISNKTPDTTSMFRRKRYERNVPGHPSSGGGSSSMTSSLADCDVGSTVLACGESISSVFCPSPSSSTLERQQKQYPPIPPSQNLPDESTQLQHFPGNDFSRSRTAPATLFPPTHGQGVGSPTSQFSNVDASRLYPPSPNRPPLPQTSLMDDTLEEEDFSHNIRRTGGMMEDSAYTYGNRTRVNPATVYLEEDNKLPPSYQDIFNLYKHDDDNADDDTPREPPANQRHGTAATAVPLHQKETITGGAYKYDYSGMSSSYMDASGHLRSQSDIDLERALYLSGLQVMKDDTRREKQVRVGVFISSDDEDDKDAVTTEGDAKSTGDERRDDAPPIYYHSNDGLGSSFLSDESSVSAPAGAMRRQDSSVISMAMLYSCYQEDFDALRNVNRIAISQATTYQGRVAGSINGCTVIAPLLCIHFFAETDVGIKTKQGFVADPGLPDETIVEVIDQETPNILPAVRKSLGLMQDAFLIPSDAHEALMDQQLLCPEQFVTVCGGNILEEEHLKPLMDQLARIGPKKVAVTFFFHEHVIAILQLRQSPTTVWYDIIDSLPQGSTLRCNPDEEQMRSIGSAGSGFGSDRVFSHSKINGSSGVLSDDELASVEGSERHMQQVLVDSIPFSHNAARIRCRDEESLKTAIRWYACSVFTSENARYIDNYEWNEKLPDFDPRVFQAFVWQEA
jgi:hypothetical protein